MPGLSTYKSPAGMPLDTSARHIVGSQETRAPGASCVATQATALRLTPAGPTGRALAGGALPGRHARPGVAPPGGVLPAVVEYGEAQGQRPDSRGRDKDTGHPVAAAGTCLPLGRPSRARASLGDPGGRPVSGGSRPGRRTPRCLGFSASGSAALGSAALAPAGAWSGLRLGSAGTASGLLGAAFCARAAGSAITGITGIGSVFASPGDDVSGLDTGCATLARGCGPPLRAGSRRGNGMASWFLGVILGLSLSVRLDRGPHTFQQSLRQRRPGHPRRRPGPVTHTAYPPRQPRRGHWRRGVGDWGLGGRGLGAGARCRGLGASLGGARWRAHSVAGASRGGAMKAEPVVAGTTTAGEAEDPCSSSRLAASAAARTRSRKDSGRTGLATRAGGRWSPSPRVR